MPKTNFFRQVPAAVIQPTAMKAELPMATQDRSSDLADSILGSRTPPQTLVIDLDLLPR